MVIPAFRRHPKSAAVIGRLVVGYGEIEFLLAWTAGAALASQNAIPIGLSKPEHRQQYEHEALTLFFKERGGKERIRKAGRIISPTASIVGLHKELCDALLIVRRCYSIRNMFAHCQFDDNYRKRGLFFVDLEDAVRKPPLVIITRHASASSLETAESYFDLATSYLNYLQQAILVRNQLALGPELSKPQKIPAMRTNSLLFPHKPVR
jgi:hypothetical protein